MKTNKLENVFIDKEIDLAGKMVVIRLRWGEHPPNIIYCNRTGRFYQQLPASKPGKYSYRETEGQILSNIEVSECSEAAN
jgi:hypothetical protein